MTESKILTFTLDEPRYALPLRAVERVLRAAEITPLPKAPEIVLGVINVQGELLPVMDIRRRFRLPLRGLEPEDRLILARTSKRRVLLPADAVTGVHQLSGSELVSAEEAVPFAAYLAGVAKLESGLVFIHDLEQFLSLEEEEQLDEAMRGKAP